MADSRRLRHPGAPRAKQMPHGIAVLLLAATIGSAFAPMARAQAQDSLFRPGARIRVSNAILGPQPVRGRALGLRGDTLLFASENYPDITMRVLCDDRTRLDVSTSHHNRLGRGILVGGLLGLGIGGIIVAVNQAANDVGETFEGTFYLMAGEQPPPHHQVSGTPAMIGLAAGGVLGALVGVSIVVDTWQPTRTTRAALRIEGDRGADGGSRGSGVRVALSFSR